MSEREQRVWDAAFAAAYAKYYGEQIDGCVGEQARAEARQRLAKDAADWALSAFQELRAKKRKR